MRIKDVSDEMIAKFTGGRGFDLKLLWDAVTEDTKWNDPENEWVVAGGPLCGITQYPWSGKSYAALISPLSEQSYDANSGGNFGHLLKFSGFDALEIQARPTGHHRLHRRRRGKNPDLRIPLRDVNAYTVSETLHDYFAKDEADKRNISVICMGKAAETTFLGCVNASFYECGERPPPEAVRARRRRHGFRTRRLSLWS
jgi:aldehyde:ferredoxin oxidoreductase